MFLDKCSDVDYTLPESFLNEYKNRKTNWGPLGKIVYKRTYSRRKDDGTMESWWETIKRVVEGVYTIQKRYCKANNFPWSEKKANNSAQEMYKRMFDMRLLSAGRGLWMMGTDYLFERKTIAPLINCWVVSTKDITTSFSDPFKFMMDMSMLGGGVGYDTRGAGKLTIREPKVKDGWVYSVPDSREGWVESIGIILDAYSGDGQLPASFDYSNIRPKGEKLEGFGGTSSGPQPLIDLHDNIPKLLDRRAGEKITSSDIVDLFSLIGKAVIAGGIRRSATLALGHKDDKDFINLKHPDHQTDFWGEPENEHHRWASNNSVVAEQGMDYSRFADSIMENGEPGFAYINNCQSYNRMGDPKGDHDPEAYIPNPCGEIVMPSYSSCNLSETFPARHDSLDDWIRSLKYSYLYNKTVTLIPHHWKKANKIQMRDRRIGASITGVVQAINKFGRRKFYNYCDKGYKAIQEWDEVYSKWLCIPRSIKTTTVKPSGSVSKLAGSTSGVHYPPAEYYIRNIRFSDNSELLPYLDEAGYKIEEDVYSDDTMVVSFPVHKKHVDKTESDVSIWEQLHNASMMQRHWSDNSVSATVRVGKDERQDFVDSMEFFESDLKTISFLPKEKGSYKQAPNIPIDEEEYQEMVNQIGEVDFNKDLNTHEEEAEDKFCSGGSCEI